LFLKESSPIFWWSPFYRAALVVGLILFSLCSCESSSTVSGKSSGRADVLEVGNEAPALSLPDLDGNVRSLADFKGKTVLLNFWATWCLPCVAEMPALERVHQLLKEQGLEVVAISVDGDRTKVKDFVQKNGLSFTVLHDPGFKTPPKFGVSGFPETIFVDSQGRIISFEDPEAKGSGRLAVIANVRVVADRPWDSAEYLLQLKKLLPPITAAPNS